MRLVTWNCNGALRRKAALLDRLNADILVVQECEDPARSTDEYREWAGIYCWAGDLKYKGMGIFARNGFDLTPLHWPDNGFKLFLPVRVDDRFTVLGVWTQSVRPSGAAYIGQFWHYFQANRARIDGATIMLGDFNSNSIWDRPRREWNHSDCVRELASAGSRSLYHEAFDELQGMETRPTYFQYRKQEMPFHIDYVFAPAELLPPTGYRLELGEAAVWLEQSDHLPMVVDWPG